MGTKTCTSVTGVSVPILLRSQLYSSVDPPVKQDYLQFQATFSDVLEQLQDDLI